MRDRRKIANTHAVFAIGALALCCAIFVNHPGFALALGASDAAPAHTRATTDRLEELEKQKLRAEIRSLDDAHTTPWWQREGSIGVIGALVAVAGLLWTIAQQRREMSRQREADRAQASRDQVARLDGLFARLATDIASPDAAVRLSAAASIESFTSPERAEYHGQLLSLLQGMVRLFRGDITDRVIARAFVNFLRLQQERGTAPSGPLDLDLACFTGCVFKQLDLRKADLRRAQLEEVRIDPTVDLTEADGRKLTARRLSARKARLANTQLDGASMQEAELRGADLRKARLRGANLISADLRDAQLNDARLQSASLQSAHLERADLRGARFNDADLRDARFEGAKLDRSVVRSIVRSQHWQSAHWDAEAEAALREAA